MIPLPIFHYSHHVFPKNLKLLFVAKLLRTLGVQFSIFFFPLFLFTVGEKQNFFPVGSSFQQGMLFIGAYYFFERFAIMITTFPVAKLGYRLGLRNSMAISQVLYILSLYTLTLVEQKPILLVLVLLIESIKIPLFWISYYSLFSTIAHVKKMGRSVGTLEFFTKLLQAAIPALSGVIIVAFGFSQMFLVAMTFQFVALIFLLFIETPNIYSKPSWKEFQVWLREPQFRLFSLSVAGKYTVDMLQHLWPFFVFLLIGSADKVGYMYFVVLFVALLLTYFTGWYIDHEKSRKPFSISGSLMGTLWLARLQVFNIWSIMAIDVVERLAESVYLPFYESILLRRGKGGKIFNYFTYREFIICAYALLFWGAFMLYFSIFESWRSVLIFGAIGMLMSMQLRDKVPQDNES